MKNMKKLIPCVIFLLLPLLFGACQTVDDGMSSMKKSFPGKESPSDTSGKSK
ncbi:MAG: hypothetical protein FWF95_07355 [Syntrophorhabdaceae bacterium]|nr:hypothetical protein [Syntrophorhabdaceae bacterium]